MNKSKMTANLSNEKVDSTSFPYEGMQKAWHCRWDNQELEIVVEQSNSTIIH